MELITDFGTYLIGKRDSVLNLSVSSAFGVVVFFLLGDGDPLAVLAISLVIHELVTAYVFFKSENEAFSRRLASSERVILMKSKIGRFATTAFCLLLPFIIAASVLIAISFVVKGSALDALDYWSSGLQRFLMIVILLGLLIDPVAYIFLEKNLGDGLTILFGYLSILMVAIGSVSEKSGGAIYLVALLIALLNVRQAFVMKFHYGNDEGGDMTFLAPSMFVLFLALLPNLLIVLEVLEI